MVYAIFALSLGCWSAPPGWCASAQAAFFGIGAYGGAALAAGGSRPRVAAAEVSALARGALRAGGRRAQPAHQACNFIMVTLAFAQMACRGARHAAGRRHRDGIYLNAKPLLGPCSTGRRRAVRLHLGCPRRRFVFLCRAAALRASAARWPASASTSSACAPPVSPPIRTSSRPSRSPARHRRPRGFLFAVKDGFVNPELMSWHLSGAVLIMIILAASATCAGADRRVRLRAAAGVLRPRRVRCLRQALAPGAGPRIIASVALLPRGLVACPAQWRERLVGATGAAEVEVGGRPSEAWANGGAAARPCGHHPPLGRVGGGGQGLHRTRTRQRARGDRHQRRRQVTLINMLSGEIPPSGGRVELLGET